MRLRPVLVVKVSAPDHFAVLGEPRRPWLDLGRLKERFLKLSSEVHPDRLHDASPSEKATANLRHTEINAAYKSLANLKERLAHLIELETGRPPRRVETIPAEIADRFIEVSRICGEADRLLSRGSEVVSPVLKVERVGLALELGARVAELAKPLEESIEKIGLGLHQLNTLWESAPPTGERGRLDQLPMDCLEDFHRRVAYLEKCGQQLRERATKLAIYCAT